MPPQRDEFFKNLLIEWQAEKAAMEIADRSVKEEGEESKARVSVVIAPCRDKDKIKPKVQITASELEAAVLRCGMSETNACLDRQQFDHLELKASIQQVQEELASLSATVEAHSKILDELVRYVRVDEAHVL